MRGIANLRRREALCTLETRTGAANLASTGISISCVVRGLREIAWLQAVPQRAIVYASDLPAFISVAIAALTCAHRSCSVARCLRPFGVRV